MRQLSKRLYEDDPPKHTAVNQNIVNIESIIEDREVAAQISPHLSNIQKCIKKMTELSK